eukprot:TRINITY_DN15108_c0_g1_i1.p1 TRINITY_DN15108_c0_g1~~TRINITY_DN15108_c0_g1_i1.p1  ORF type:complete len:1242 (-),score=288.02 TRINITY_DN15108_c0_g1_i1:856-4581(-)
MAASTKAEAEMAKGGIQEDVVQFLLQKDYVLTAFELLHEFLEDGQLSAAQKLQDFFSDEKRFPPDHMLELRSLPEIKLQTLSQKAAVSEYELRLAREDVQSLQERLEEQAESLSTALAAASSAEARAMDMERESGNGAEDEDDEKVKISKVLSKRQQSVKTEAIPQEERRDLNCAVKEYLVAAGYRLTAMTFRDEVVGQDIDKWEPGPAHVEKALRTYYNEFLSNNDACEQMERMTEEAQEMAARLRAVEGERDALAEERRGHAEALTKAQRDVVDREHKILDLQKSLAASTKTMNSAQSEVTALKLHLQQVQLEAEESAQRVQRLEAARKLAESQPLLQADADTAELSSTGRTRSPNDVASDLASEDEKGGRDRGVSEAESRESMLSLESGETSTGTRSPAGSTVEDVRVQATLDTNQTDRAPLANGEEPHQGASIGNGPVGATTRQENGGAVPGLEDLKLMERTMSDKLRQQSLEDDGAAVLIIADSLPKIIPNVLINKREELLPLIMCAIERHPAHDTRDALTHSLFNLIKKPDETQRRIIMNACVTLAGKVGEERTESELLPQCWEQINHKYEERRLLVAQSCGELAKFVRPAIRSSLIFSILQQLAVDPTPVVRLATSRNLAMLLMDFEDLDKYSQVEELVFQLLCDPVEAVVNEALQKLVPALLAWTRAKRQPLSQFLRALLNRMVGSVQRCPPSKAGEGTVDTFLRSVGETQRWSTDVLLRTLVEVLPEVRNAALKTCPAALRSGSSSSSAGGDPNSPLSPTKAPLSPTTPDVKDPDKAFSHDLLSRYAKIGSEVRWPALDWVAGDCLPAILQLACMLPPKEESLRLRLSRVLLSLGHVFGRHYLACTLLPLVLAAAGYPIDTTGVPAHIGSKIESLKPVGVAGERLARMCVLPLLLTGVLGARGLREKTLADYLRELMLSTSLRSGPWSYQDSPDLIDAVRFLSSHKEHQAVLLSVLWELVVNPTPSVRMTAAVNFQALAAYVDVKTVTQKVLPALVTLGADSSPDVKYSSIAAFGAVALHFKDETIVEKIRIQLDSYLDEGSPEAAIAVIRALTAAVPVTTPSLRDYLAQKVKPMALSLLSPVAGPVQLVRQREKAEFLCAAMRALDAADLSSQTVQTYLLPSVQALLTKPEILEATSRESLENILRERGGIRLDNIGKVGKSLFMNSGLFASGSEGGGAGSGQAALDGTMAQAGAARNFLGRKYEEILVARAGASAAKGPTAQGGRQSTNG